MEIPGKCSDCVQPCDEECLGHRTEDEQVGLLKYLKWKYENNNPKVSSSQSEQNNPASLDSLQ